MKPPLFLISITQIKYSVNPLEPKIAQIQRFCYEGIYIAVLENVAQTRDFRFAL